jgi:hypothetical protein
MIMASLPTIKPHLFTMSGPYAMTSTETVDQPATDHLPSFSLTDHEDSDGDHDAMDTTNPTKTRPTSSFGPFVSPYEAECIPPPISQSPTMLQLL